MRFLLAATLLAALAASPARTQPAEPLTHPFSCPPEGVLVTDDQGNTRRYDGADPADPLVCRMRFTVRGRAEVPLRLLLGVFQLPEGPGAAPRRAAAAGLVPWRVGQVSRFIAPGHDGLPDQIEWEVQGLSMANTPAGLFRTLTILERTTTRGPDGAPAQGSFIHRIDVETSTFIAYAGGIQHGGRSIQAMPVQAQRITRGN